MNLSEQPTISPDANVKDCIIGKYTEIADGAKISKSSLGDYSYIKERSDIIYTDIGKFVNIASDVRINPGNHPMEWVSQHHFLYRLKQYNFGKNDHDTFFKWRSLQRVTIGHDIWIGHKAIILPGVSVGNGSVIGAGAVVSRDVPPYSIAAGVPAKIIRPRFPKAIWQQLEQIGWWDWKHEIIRERLKDFYDIRLFIDKYSTEQ